MKNELNTLAAMLTAYRNNEREFPSYEDLAGLLNAQPRVSCDPAENEAIARDAQAMVDAEVLALPVDNAWKQFCGRVNRPAAAAPQVVADERAAFEVAARRITHSDDSSFEREGDDYVDYTQSRHWAFWSARAAIAAKAAS